MKRIPLPNVSFIGVWDGERFWRQKQDRRRRNSVVTGSTKPVPCLSRNHARALAAMTFCEVVMMPKQEVLR